MRQSLGIRNDVYSEYPREYPRETHGLDNILWRQPCSGRLGLALEVEARDH